MNGSYHIFIYPQTNSTIVHQPNAEEGGMFLGRAILYTSHLGQRYGGIKNVR